jgi:pyruvate dehydrogenase E2 component (dihydrolipoyllysine-residue acetyltransferase)
MYEVTMPKLSDSMEEGKIIEWKVKAGDSVSTGDVLAEVESDKAVMELEAFRDGVIAEIKYGDDAEVRVGAVIALIDSESGGAEDPTTKTPRHEEEHKEDEEKGEEGEPEPERQVDAPAPPPAAPKKEPAPQAHSAFPVPHSAFKIISPYAKKLADDAGIDYQLLKGSGPDGRIVATDVEAATKVLKRGAAAPKPPATARPDDDLPELDISEDEADVEEMSFRLKTQALRVVQSKHLIPHFYITRGADVTKLLERRKALKEEMGATVTHLVAHACVKALEANPSANWSYDRGKIIKWKGINLGLAVATDQGLTVAVIRDAGQLSFKEMVTTAADLVDRARKGKLRADERRHPSFTITNLGMYDIEHFEPIINPPSSITLAVSSALPDTVVRNDEIFIGKVMKLSASCDHRIVDGATAAQFLASLVDLLENPDELLENE